MSNKVFFKHLIDRYYLSFYINKLNINEIIKSNDKSNYLYNFQTNIKKILNVLKKYNITNVTPEDINNAFYIYKNNYIALDNKKNLIDRQIEENLKYNLISSSKELINYMIIYDIYDDYCILKLCNRIKRYKKTLIEWVDADNNHLIKSYSETYYNLQNIKENIIQNRNRKDIYMEDLDRIKKIDDKQIDILKKIKKLDGIEMFKNTIPNIDNNNILYQENIQKSYWKFIDDDLSIYPIKLHLIKNHIIHIKNIIYNIIPDQKNLLEDIGKNINLINIKLDSYYIITCVNYLFSIAIKLQSKIHIENTDKYHRVLKSSMIEGDELVLFLPKTLKYLTELFYKIWDEKIASGMSKPALESINKLTSD